MRDPLIVGPHPLVPLPEDGGPHPQSASPAQRCGNLGSFELVKRDTFASMTPLCIPLQSFTNDRHRHTHATDPKSVTSFTEVTKGHTRSNHPAGFCFL